MPTVVIKTLRASGGDYTTMSAWEAGEQADLVAADEQHVLECYDDWAGGLADFVFIQGWTTDATRNIVVKAAAGHEYDPIADTGFYIRCTTLDNCIELNCDYIHLEDFKVYSEQKSAIRANSSIGRHNELRRMYFGNNNNDGIARFDRYSFPAVMENCICYGYGEGIYFDRRSTGTSTALVRNCVFHSTNSRAMTPFTAGSGIEVNFENCAFIRDNAGDAFYTTGSTWLGTYSNNATSDATIAIGTSNQVNLSATAGVDFVNSAANDYRPAVGGKLLGNGADLSGSFTNDIRRLDRAKSPAWSIGAFREHLTITKTLRSSGGDYTTMSAWEAAEQGDLIALDEDHVLDCYNDWPSGLSDAVNLSGWVTALENGIVIKAADGHEHDGTPGSGFWITNNTSWVKTIGVSVPYVMVQSIEARHPATGSGFGATAGIAYFTIVFDRCIAKDCNGGTGQGGFYIRRQVLRNCLAVDCSNTGIGYHTGYFGYEADNCTVANCGEGFRSGSGIDNHSEGVSIRNCVAYGNTTNYNIGQVYTPQTSNNAASDAITTPPPGTNYLNIDVAAGDFQDAANDDYCLSPSSQLIGVGTDLSSEFDIDIRGVNRTIAPAWSIGAFRERVDVVKSLRNSGGDYTTMSAWEAAEQADLVSEDLSHTLECYNDWVDGLDDKVTIAGWVTSSDQNLKITAPVGHRHNGMPGTGFRLRRWENWATLFTPQVKCLVEHIEVEATSTGSSANGVFAQHDGAEFDSCIFLAAGSSYAFTAARDVTVRNCIARGGTYAFLTNDWEGPKYQNCLAYDSGYGFAKSGSSNAKPRYENCVAYGCSNSYAGGYDPASQYNAASNGATVTPPGAGSLQVDIVSSDFTDAANDDYSLSSNSQLKEAGADLSGTFTTDILGTVRSVPFSIGAFNNPVGGGDSTVTSDSALQWNLLQSVKNDRSLQWNIFNAIQSDSALQWDIINHISNDSALQWQIIQAIQSDSSLHWDILSSVLNDAELHWNLLSTTLKDSTLQWNIDLALTSVASSAEFRWDILESLSSNSTIQWNVIGQVGNDVALQWNIISDSAFPDVSGVISINTTTRKISSLSSTKKFTAKSATGEGSINSESKQVDLQSLTPTITIH